MNISIDDDGRRLRVGLSGAVRWNDRLLLSALAGRLRESSAASLVLDGTGADEADLGAFGGLAATARRMAAVSGRHAVVLPPVARPGAA